MVGLSTNDPGKARAIEKGGTEGSGTNSNDQAILYAVFPQIMVEIVIPGMGDLYAKVRRWGAQFHHVVFALPSVPQSQQ